jgi:hypothetical protein
MLAFALCAGGAAIAACGGQPRTSAVVAIEAIRTATPAPTPVPATWFAALDHPPDGAPVLLSCLDADGDGQLTGNDDARFDGMALALDPAKSCTDAHAHADFYADETPVDCDDGARVVLLVLVGGGGTDLLQASIGESIGMVHILDSVRTRLSDGGLAVRTILASPAVFGGVPPQGTMERYLTAEVGRRLDASPCLEAVILGHSHGGVTVTDVTAALEGRASGRMFGVLLDRSSVLYDGDADTMPQTTPILNVYQLNEGWHGVAIDQPNVTNVDESLEYAPLAPTDGGNGLARVSHKTLDDATGARHRIEDAIVAWAMR